MTIGLLRKNTNFYVKQLHERHALCGFSTCSYLFTFKDLHTSLFTLLILASSSLITFLS